MAKLDCRLMDEGLAMPWISLSLNWLSLDSVRNKGVRYKPQNSVSGSSSLRTVGTCVAAAGGEAAGDERPLSPSSVGGMFFLTRFLGVSVSSVLAFRPRFLGVFGSSFSAFRPRFLLLAACGVSSSSASAASSGSTGSAALMSFFFKRSQLVEPEAGVAKPASSANLAESI